MKLCENVGVQCIREPLDGRAASTYLDRMKLCVALKGEETVCVATKRQQMTTAVCVCALCARFHSFYRVSVKIL